MPEDTTQFVPLYELNGRRVSGTPRPNHIYIREGKKFVLPTTL